MPKSAPAMYLFLTAMEQCKVYSAFEIAAELECEDIFPKIVCHCCYLTLRQIQTARENQQFREADLVPRTWLPNSNPCMLCQDVPTIHRGQPKKIKAKGRPRVDDIDHTSPKHTTHTQIFRSCTQHNYFFDSVQNITKFKNFVYI